MTAYCAKRCSLQGFERPSRVGLSSPFFLVRFHRAQTYSIWGLHPYPTCPVDCPLEGETLQIYVFPVVLSMNDKHNTSAASDPAGKSVVLGEDVMSRAQSTSCQERAVQPRKENRNASY